MKSDILYITAHITFHDLRHAKDEKHDSSIDKKKGTTTRS